ncbi:unnamed protein product [Amoebophrya sp. A120]|nr:unnamed protein product [Amoebophrya sp. A120]CAD7975323.1 unnamed protein product [Amoebophrya sp. A120]|eukprot:GSA120T00025314001.1
MHIQGARKACEQVVGAPEQVVVNRRRVLQKQYQKIVGAIRDTKERIDAVVKLLEQHDNVVERGYYQAMYGTTVEQNIVRSQTTNGDASAGTRLQQGQPSNSLVARPVTLSSRVSRLVVTPDAPTDSLPATDATRARGFPHLEMGSFNWCLRYDSGLADDIAILVVDEKTMLRWETDALMGEDDVMRIGARSLWKLFMDLCYTDLDLRFRIPCRI